MSREIPSREGYALVTGGKARLGAAIARKLAGEGWNIVIHAHHVDAAADALATEINGRVVVGDLSDAAFCKDIFKQAGDGFCSLLVNNASLFEYDDISTVTVETMDAHYHANVRGPVLLARSFA